MNLKEFLIEELDGVSDLVLIELLDFLHFLKAKQAENTADLIEARQALTTVASEGTISWDELKAESGL